MNRPLLCALILCSFTLLVSSAQARPQSRSSVATHAQIRTVPVAPAQAALDKHDFAWIKTANDFDQTALTDSEIDAHLQKLITGYDRETPIVLYEVPIHSKRLTYLGKRKYTDCDKRITAIDSADLGKPFSKEAEFFQYAGYIIAVPGNSAEDQLRVYSLCRALEILRYRYPQAYQRLFVGMQMFPSATPNQGRFRHSNRFDKILFTFDESPKSIAASATLTATEIAPDSTQNQGMLTEISISYTGMRGLGSNEAGSQLLYQASPDENFMRYLREGMLESLVHEMLHCAITYHASHDPIAYALWSERQAPTKLSNNDKALAGAGEEAAVNAASTQFFLREGGLQPNVLFWNRGALEFNINRLQKASVLTNYLTLLDPENAGSYLYVKRLPLPYLD
jgi:hypothetical protein